MPTDNIERAVKRGLGTDNTTNYEDLTYEVYGPNGVAMLVELSTDNRNRAAAEITSLVTKSGGIIASARGGFPSFSPQRPDDCFERSMPARIN